MATIKDDIEYIVYQIPPTREEIKERIKQEEIQELENEIEEKAKYNKNKRVKDAYLLKKYLELIGVDYRGQFYSSDIRIPIIDKSYYVDTYGNITKDIREVIKQVKRAKEINANS